MLSVITIQRYIPKSHHSVSGLSCSLNPSLIFECSPKKKFRGFEKAAILTQHLGFTAVGGTWRFERNLDNSWCCGCKRGEGELESEILDFMAKSEKPTMFPTKEELMKAGRTDLVEAIKERGGWYTLGWDEENAVDNVEEALDLDIRDFQSRVENFRETASLIGHYDDSVSGYEKEDGFSPEVNSNSGILDSLQSTTSESMGRSLEIGASEDAGIEGILSRLEKQRNNDLGISLEKTEYKVDTKSKGEGENSHLYASSGGGRTEHVDNGSLMTGFHHKGLLNTSTGKISPKIEPETWRTWSIQRAGTQYEDFEAAEISFSKNGVETDKEIYRDGIAVTTEEYAEDWQKPEEITHNQIETRLQQLESELTTALNSLKSEREEFFSEEVTGSSSQLPKLSDEWEFQQNEFMSAHDRLRSIKAKLAVLEGKMALAITDTQKKVELKQNQIDEARKALQLLQTTYIVWPNLASEVLLAGSFDGWTTQRKMEKSKTGIFSVCLQLYPGRYEIKFIVDGVWKIDPLRPIVNNNGYENNLLIVT